MKYIILLVLSFEVFAHIDEIKKCKKNSKKLKFENCIKPYIDQDLSERKKKKLTYWLYFNKITSKSLEDSNIREKKLNKSSVLTY